MCLSTSTHQSGFYRQYNQDVLGIGISINYTHTHTQTHTDPRTHTHPHIHTRYTLLSDVACVVTSVIQKFEMAQIIVTRHIICLTNCPLVSYNIRNSHMKV